MNASHTMLLVTLLISCGPPEWIDPLPGERCKEPHGLYPVEAIRISGDKDCPSDIPYTVEFTHGDAYGCVEYYSNFSCNLDLICSVCAPDYSFCLNSTSYLEVSADGRVLRGLTHLTIKTDTDSCTATYDTWGAN